MWFCTDCREKVEKNIIPDLEIEEKCHQIMIKFENRVSRLEEISKDKCDTSVVSRKRQDIEEKCDKKEVMKIVKDEFSLNKGIISPQNMNNIEDIDNNVISSVISEMNEQKNREDNIVFYGVTELNSKNGKERQSHDCKIVNEIMNLCDIVLDNTDLIRTSRIGKYDSEKHRPLLVTGCETENKKKLFRNFNSAQSHDQNSKMDKIRVGHDLTQSERIEEKKLFSKAKELTQQSKGEFNSKVRGPPWARKIVKVSGSVKM
ncbi:hypothetical protein ACF0H5_001433 [Mactra antiquata]